MRRLLILVAMITAAPAFAHVAPSVDDNNRYLKITPQADRVRLAYTVFIGEVPGLAARRQIDTNRDGTIADTESQPYGDRLAADVLAALEVSADGKQQRIAWKQVIVGMGSPSTNAGSFSIDMIAYVCLAKARGRHEVLVRDRFRVPKPGETEVRVEDGLGVKIERARIGQASALGNEFKFVGPGGPLADDGVAITFLASDEAPLSNDCVIAAAPEESSTWLAIIGATVLVLAVAITIFVRSRRRS